MHIINPNTNEIDNHHEESFISEKETTSSESHERTSVQFMYPEDQIAFVAPVSEDTIDDTLDNKERLVQLQKDCPDFKFIVDYLINNGLPDDDKLARKVAIETERYQIVNDILFHFDQRRCKRQADELKFTKQLCIPKPIRDDVLRSYHDSLAGGGHLDMDKVHESIRSKYWWPTIYADVDSYVKSCNQCQMAKRNYNKFNPPLQPMPAVGRFERWQIDILGPLPKSPEGYSFILLAIDAFTRWTEAFPLRSQEAKEIARVLYDQIICRYGAPRILFSDRGRSFMSKLINALSEIFQITQHFTSSYHPQTNGLVERQNSTLAQSLRIYCGKDQTKWPNYLQSIMMAFRKSPAMNTTEYSPFYMVFGQEMKIPFDIALIPKDNLGQQTKEHIEEIKSNLKLVQEISAENDKKHKAKDKERHDQKAKTPDFKVGDVVLKAINQIPVGKSRKLYNKFEGPYHIQYVGDNYTYKLIDLRNNKPHKSMINACHLKHYNDPKVHRKNDNESSSEDDDEENDQIDQSQSQNTQIDQPPNVQAKAQTQIPATPVNPQTPQTSNTEQSSQVPNKGQKTYKFVDAVGARWKHNRREIRILWNDGSRSWEPNESFDQETLQYINSKYTQRGTRKRSCFKNKRVNK